MGDIESRALALREDQLGMNEVLFRNGTSVGNSKRVLVYRLKGPPDMYNLKAPFQKFVGKRPQVKFRTLYGVLGSLVDVYKRYRTLTRLVRVGLCLSNNRVEDVDVLRASAKRKQ